MKFIVAHSFMRHRAAKIELQKKWAREIFSHFFGCNFSPYVFLRKLFRQTPPSFPEWRAFWVASNNCSCRSRPSSPLSNSNQIQTIIYAAILEVIRARNICRKCLYKNSEIIWRFITLTPPHRLTSLAQELRLYGKKLLSLRLPLWHTIFLRV